MIIEDIIQIVGTSIVSLGIVAAGLGYLLSMYRKGNKQENVEVVNTANQLTDFWKDQIQGFKEMAREQDTKIQLLSNEVNLLKGQLMEKDKQIDTYLKILQNRNPEMERFMKDIIQFSIDHETTHKEIIRILGEIHSYAKVEHDRDFKINATVTNQ